MTNKTTVVLPDDRKRRAETIDACLKASDGLVEVRCDNGVWTATYRPDNR